MRDAHSNDRAGMLIARDDADKQGVKSREAGVVRFAPHDITAPLG
jgi:hypothetical protein